MSGYDAPAEDGAAKRIRPTRVAPLSFFLRENSRELLQALSEDDLTLSHAAQDVYQALKATGAAFFAAGFDDAGL